MTRLFSITFFCVLIGCADNSPRQTFLPPDKNDISEVIEAVIKQDSSLLQSKSVAHFNTIPLLLDLRKLRVILTDTTTDRPPPIDHTAVSIFNLFNSLVDNQRFFNRTDSSYFFFQNETVKTFTIDTTTTTKGLVATITLAEQQQKQDLNKSIQYYDLTIPIFSADNRKAYVERTRNCIGCSGATSFYLGKINDRWTVVGWQRRWME